MGIKIFRYFIKNTALIMMAGVFAFTSAGCGELDNTKIVLTTGFTGDELFRIEDLSCTLPEFMVYYVNSKDAYQNSFGEGIWDTTTDGESFDEKVKKNCLSTLAQVKAMNLLARENEIELSDQEISQAKSAAEEYYGSLTSEEISAMKNVTKDQIENLYKEYALADKLYEYIIKDINPEISDDEARTITVEQIVFKTYTLDSQGEKVSVSDSEKSIILNNARSILDQINEGADFDVLMEQYNEADEGTVSFGKGEVDKIIEDAAFDLDSGEVSGIIETNDSYVILKCISTFNREETEANKVRIVEERKREVFGEQYDAFTASLSKTLNTDLWNNIKSEESENVTTTSFFDVYHNYF
ncbi:peptidylprolyl isomerase [Butyrivibrio sp. NC2002]|uniref:peptidylprolyl isomerase n=1 Tax=Butyrivibrio sp. NC2002 TaxID=1410610 RepID=UPI00055FD7D8|nr:peptidylprolyl isomerase [Butyrivibrio sp. NC2002]